MRDDVIHSLVVGGGPAAISLLLAARGEGLLKTMVQRGIKVINKTEALGCGELGCYTIHSDSFAESFVNSANIAGIPTFDDLNDNYPGAVVNSLRGSPVDLTIAADYLAEIGSKFSAWDHANSLGLFETKTRALESRVNEDHIWVTTCKNKENKLIEFRSKSLILATGAEQCLDNFRSTKFCAAPLAQKYYKKLILSKDALSLAGPSLISSRIIGINNPKITILGGSHSAVSSAWVCLNKLHAASLDNMLITLLYRNKLAITYQSSEAAHRDGYFDFDLNDICPKTGRVYPLAGFRSDSRELMRSILGLGGLSLERRVRLIKVGDCADKYINDVLEDSDIIIVALGYRPRALPLFDQSGQQLILKSSLHNEAPLVDDRSRVLDKNSEPVKNVFCMGLSAGYPLQARYGEPSFTGQANGIALWQSDIGSEIIHQILAIS